MPSAPLATFIQHAQQRSVGHGLSQQRGFTSHAAAFAVVDLNDLCRAKRKRAARAVESGQIVSHQHSFRAATQAAHRADAHAHQGAVDESIARSSCKPGVHIFSS